VAITGLDVYASGKHEDGNHGSALTAVYCYLSRCISSQRVDFDVSSAWAHVKLAGFALWPIGKMIVPA
jgi:hypothetical protein